MGAQLARQLPPGAVLALHGDLGAGKTEFVKGLAEGLGCAEPVTSPTFTLVHEYRGGRLPLFHFDWYRLKRAEELDEIGFDDYADVGGVVAVEWAARFPERLPPDTRHVHLRPADGDAREVWW